MGSPQVKVLNEKGSRKIMIFGLLSPKQCKIRPRLVMIMKR